MDFVDGGSDSHERLQERFRFTFGHFAVLLIVVGLEVCCAVFEESLEALSLNISVVSGFDGLGGVVEAIVVVLGIEFFPFGEMVGSEGIGLLELEFDLVEFFLG